MARFVKVNRLYVNIDWIIQATLEGDRKEYWWNLYIYDPAGTDFLIESSSFSSFEEAERWFLENFLIGPGPAGSVKL